ncbi:TPA: glutamate--tRNA ligase [Patescibacteria group bacterium]|uniref:Glutamate--tRNA ligase n=2 Tax=Bacteria division Kazan-3B-28 TaxID=1798534 RepID=A0A0G1ZFU9_UNCK3|nr:MAG: glutamyl-tRNA synthetase, glutamyl-tRNA synthetase [candidate division Kazan bacterium GW2011_GWA1_50_15]KKW25461.1 MAG: Glutamate-tRNA ligase [candidate division Kazan bacterium GW2011_GWC1_52_13]KKW26767.1 MAG: Glutamate-tRNA ligase [candidate division Kazan bacterium GW2011_GWB1_52_7]HAV65763.1 glutamate--tRNA ligase [Patescibacteria group bacterium]HCL47773.1 glutamate--tRNA ligase [Patescibacteria group bacterium]
MEGKVRVRFAPSPTGPLHVGGARTALFNYLYAKHAGGVFVLRFEDTDTERNESVFEESITDGLKWLGLNWDEDHYQSKRADVYRRYLEKLTSQGLTYEQDGGVYFKLPAEPRVVVVDDIIRGKVEFNSKNFDDIVLMKKTGTPTFNFANVVDDIDMSITHVIRGEDHLSNTPKHILLYEAFAAPIPRFAHLPLLLNLDRSKMSKRTGDTAVDDYRRAGYLPEAMLNFLAQLGWSDPDGQDFLPLDELVKKFSLERVQKAGAVFDLQRLNHLNQHYLMRKSLDEYIELAKPFIAHLSGDELMGRFALALIQDRAQTLSEIPGLIEYFFKTPDYEANLLVFKKSSPEQTGKGLNATLTVLEALEDTDWNQVKLQQILDETLSAEGLQPGDMFWPVRVALSGEEGSPSPVELLEALGKTESISRIKTAINKLV